VVSADRALHPGYDRAAAGDRVGGKPLHAVRITR
jgi:hypothetical protein